MEAYYGGCGTEDEAVFRLAVGEGSAAIRGGRGGETRAWRRRVCRPRLAVRSEDDPRRAEGIGGVGGSGGRPGPKKRGGRRPLTEAQPQLEANLRQVLQEFTAGDPMRAGVLWTNLSLRELSRRLGAMGTPAGRRTIRRLLRQLGLGRRTARKKKTMGHHPDRNAQFENIARLRQEYLDAGDPVISIDTKKKELLGNFHRSGPTFTQQTVETNDHDFARAGQGKLIPHGVYDLANGHAHISLNTSHDTGELCCDSIAAWWEAARPRGLSTGPAAADSVRRRGEQQRDAIPVQGRPATAGRPPGAGTARGRIIRPIARSTIRSSIACFRISRGPVKE